MQNDDAPLSSVFNRIISQGEVDTEFGIKAASKLRDQEREAYDTMNPEVVDEYAAADEYQEIGASGKSSKRSGSRLVSAGKRSTKSTTADEDDGVWGDLEKPFVGFKMASMTLKRLKK